MKHRIIASIGLALLMLLGFAGGASAADKVKAVASFSILGDMVKQVGGDRVDVITLVGPNGDAHVYQPTPADAKNLAAAQILFTNGLGFEGWMDRLEKSSGFKGTVVVASTGVKPRTMVEDAKTITDPHAWQSLANGRLYVTNIRDGLIAVDPEGKSFYEANTAKYLDEIAKEESDVKAALAALPQDRRKIITSHGAFGYFGAAYGLEIIAPEGVSTESEASPGTSPRSSARSRPNTSRRCSWRTSPTTGCSTRSPQRPGPRSAASFIPMRCHRLTGLRPAISTCSATMSGPSLPPCRPSVVLTLEERPPLSLPGLAGQSSNPCVAT